MAGTNRSMGMALGTAGLLLLGSMGSARADKMMQWKDEQGRIHFSNVGSSEEATQAPPAAGEPPAEGAAAPAEDNSGTAAEKKGPLSDASDEVFSTQVSRERTRLRRELQAQKAKAAEIDQKRAAQRSPGGPAQESVQLGEAQRPTEIRGSEDEALEKEGQKVADRIAEIRKQYDELHDEAVKRHGGQPSWWLPLD